MDFRIGENVQMKKTHACGGDKWKINRIGADFKIVCIKCGRQVMISRVDFERAFKQKVEE